MRCATVRVYARLLDTRPVRKEDTPRPADGLGKAVDGQDGRGGVLRIVKFALASAIGFLLYEAILVLGVLAVYHTTKVPGITSSSLAILGLDALAFGVGVTAAFVINERVTIKGHGRGGASWLVRWGKYQLASLLGNVIIVVVQLALLATISLSPVLGSVVGAVVSYPVTYAVSMYFVWRVHPLRDQSEVS